MIRSCGACAVGLILKPVDPHHEAVARGVHLPLQARLVGEDPHARVGEVMDNIDGVPKTAREPALVHDHQHVEGAGH
jgi:hypothetical protein